MKKNQKQKNNKKVKNRPRKNKIRISSKMGLEEVLFLVVATDNKEREHLIIKLKKLKDKRLKTIIKESKNPKDFIKNLKIAITASINQEVEEIKQRLSAERKSGKDHFIEEIKLLSLGPKIKMFEATEEKKDLLKVKKIVASIKKG